ncbi:DUF4179 domain-containing protein [Clostridium thermobutyricum]|uniref:DUF4179 domain-containing protein n=1 Tax=Clostridium thermobutyricum DSM 4928 TaxID=1121339 RepID=A0A1V4SY59_9CLOT|nr:DUF4179 domain-containing protein [Clostridium thermobutyricum]OPX48654.1 hypothetical protein CLTHE_11130 [Clostridium thermobutyricum DSM 4928]
MRELDKIKVPNNLDKLTDKAIEKGVKYKKSQKRKVKYIGMVAVFSLIFTTGLVTTGVADEIPLLGNVFKELRNELGLRGEVKGVNISTEPIVQNGVSIQAQDAICDDYGVYVSFVVKTDKDKPFLNDLNDKQLLVSERGVVDFEDGELETLGLSGLQGKFIDEHTFIGVKSFSFNGKKDIPKNFNINVEFESVALNSVEDNVPRVSGNWKFNIPVEYKKGIKEINTNIKNGNIEIEKINIGKLNTELVVKGPKNIMQTDEATIFLYDDKGKEIYLLNRFDSDSDKVVYKFGGVSEDTKEITVKFSDGTMKKVKMD